MSTVKSYTTESVLATLGYPDALEVDRQHARMILLKRLARYQAGIRELEVKWGCTLEDLRMRPAGQGSEEEEAEVDDDYRQWQWYADAIETVNAQLAAISEPINYA